MDKARIAMLKAELQDMQDALDKSKKPSDMAFYQMQIMSIEVEIAQEEKA